MAVTFTATTQHVLLVKNAKIVYEPSAYKGSGAGIRKNLVLAVDQDTRDQISAIEAQMNLGPTLCSVLKKTDSIRVKVDTDQVRIFDADHHQINLPDKWIHPNVEARLELRGIWRTATNCAAQTFGSATTTPSHPSR